MNGKTKIEKAWIAAGMSAFVAYRLWNGGSGGDDPLSFLLETVMFFLSFPLGPAAMLPVAIAYDSCDRCGEVKWMLDWSVVLFVGYLQWFWIVPSIRERGRHTFLSLSPRADETGDNARRDDGPAEEAARLVAAEVRGVLSPAVPDARIAAVTTAQQCAQVAVARTRRRRKRRRVKAGGPPPHFDDAGLTPLGKVLAEP